VRGRGVPRRGGGQGDLLVTVKVAVPPYLEGAALEALEKYAAAERASGFDPRARWAGSR
jgi:molecular chaperone DnaJ